MKILIDTADINAIKKAYEYLPMDGVTCNPSILLKNGKNPKDALKEISEFLDLQKDEFHIQAVGETCEDFLNDAKAITDTFGKDVFIKIPAVLEGYCWLFWGPWWTEALQVLEEGPEAAHGAFSETM